MKTQFNESAGVPAEPAPMVQPQGYQVIGERAQEHDDFRWRTRNTKLAAAMLVLNFQLARPTPFSVVIGAQKEEVTFWLFPYIENSELPAIYERSDGKRILEARQVEAEWVQNTEGQLPEVYWMRCGLEARDEMIGVTKQIPTSGQALNKRTMFHTTSIRDAAVARSCRMKFHGWRDSTFYFEQRASLCVAESQRHDSKKRPRWALLGILQQSLLMDAVKGSKRQATSAEVKGPRGTAFIPAGMSTELKRAYLQQVDGV